MTTGTVIAVVVTYNRYASLTTTLNSIDGQTRPPNHIILVDNASPDGTAERIRRERPDIELIANVENVGPGAAISAGMRRALEHGAEICWLVEDDTTYDPTYLEVGINLMTANPDIGMLGARGFRVRWGRWQGVVTPDQGIVEAFPLLDGALVTSATMARVGFPVENYFVMLEDIEYGLRVADADIRAAISQQLIVHPGGLGASDPPSAGFRAYYQTRNHLRLALHRRSLPILLAFVWRTVRLISTSLVRSKPHHTALRLRGIGDALRGRMGRTVEPPVRQTNKTIS